MCDPSTSPKTPTPPAEPRPPERPPTPKTSYIFHLFCDTYVREYETEDR